MSANPSEPVKDEAAGTQAVTDGQKVDPNAASAAIISQQQAQIKALIDQTNALSAQVVSLIKGGAQIRDDKAKPEQPSHAASSQASQASQAQQLLNLGMNLEPDPFTSSTQAVKSLEELAGEIGKKS